LLILVQETAAGRRLLLLAVVVASSPLRPTAVATNPIINIFFAHEGDAAAANSLMIIKSKDLLYLLPLFPVKRGRDVLGRKLFG